MSSQKGFWNSANAFTVLLIVGVGTGAILGLILGPKAAVLKPIGQIFINLLFTLVTPLVFFSIAGAVSSMSDMKRLGKLLGSTLGIFVFTGVIVSVLTIILLKVIDPCQGMALPNIASDYAKTAAAAKTTFGDHIVKMLTVNDFPQLLSKSNMLSFLVFSVFFGLCVPLVGEKGKNISRTLNDLAEVFYKMVNVLMKFAPIGLGAYFANLTGVFGPKLLGSLANAVLFYYPTALAYFFIFNPFYCYMAGGMDCIKAFFKYFLTPSVTAFGTSSSCATIPAQREFCDKVGVPRDVSGVVIPMGATMHMDGTCMGTILKIYVASMLFGVPWNDFGAYTLTVLLAVGSATAASAVPGGGAIAAVMIISVMGLPPEALGILLMIGALIDPMGTMVNSTGDSVSSFMVTRILEGKDWMKKNLSGKQEINW